MRTTLQMYVYIEGEAWQEPLQEHFLKMYIIRA